MVTKNLSAKNKVIQMLAVFNSILVHDRGCYAGYNVQAGSMQYVTRQVRVGGNKGIQCRTQVWLHHHTAVPLIQ